MYKVQVECENKCNVLLMSKQEIKTIRNNGAKVIYPDKLVEEPDKTKLSYTQIDRLIKALESIQSQGIEKPQNESSDKCLALEKLKYESYSCYVDSVLFTLFSFSTRFVEQYLLNPNMEQIQYILENTETINESKLTKQQVQKVLEYIRRINLILIDINKHFRGVERMDYCRTLRPVLLKDPLMILQEKPEYVFAQKKQEDAGELVQALFKTFYVNTLLLTTVKTLSNSLNPSIEELVRSENIVEAAPFLVLSPSDLQSSELSINKITSTKLDIDEYYFGDQQTNSTYQMNLVKADRLKKLQEISVLMEMITKLRTAKKTTVYMSLPKFTQLVNLILNDNIDQILENYSLNELKELYRIIRDKAGSYFTDTLFPLIKKLKTNPKSAYVNIGQDLVKLHSIFYDTVRESETYNFKGEEDNKFLVINVKRFEGMKKKDVRSIEIPVEIKIADTTLSLNQIIVHSGSDITAGHYTVRFRCNDNWYLYDDIGPELKEIGSFEKLVNEDSSFVKNNCTILVYNDIHPSV